MWKRAFMAATLLLLVALLAIVPRLTGPREDIASVPRVVLNYVDDQLVVLVTSLSGTYLYDTLHLNVTTAGGEEGDRWVAHQRLTLEERVSLQGPVEFHLEAAVQDARGVWFDAALQVNATPTDGSWTFRLVTEPGRLPQSLTAEDLAESPFATLLKRRGAS